jgi:hypothetical protein
VYWRWSNIIKFGICLIWFTLVHSFIHLFIFHRSYRCGICHHYIHKQISTIFKRYSTIVYRHVLVFHKTYSTVVDFCPLQKVNVVYFNPVFYWQVVDIITFPITWILTCSRARQGNDTSAREHSFALAERLFSYC